MLSFKKPQLLIPRDKVNLIPKGKTLYDHIFEEKQDFKLNQCYISMKKTKIKKRLKNAYKIIKNRNKVIRNIKKSKNQKEQFLNKIQKKIFTKYFFFMIKKGNKNITNSLLKKNP